MPPEIDVTDQEVDALFDKFGGEDADGPTITEDEPSEVPAEIPAETPAPEVPLAAKPAAPTEEQHLELTVNGRPVRAPLSQVLKWAQQGYDYPQKMAELNRQREEISGLEKSYKPIDEWVRANPDKWEQLQAIVEAKNQGYGDLPPDHPIIKELQEVKQIASEWKQERTAAQAKAEDQALDEEIQSIRDKYKDLDWLTVDDSGRTREQKVLAHAVEHGFKTFKTAFLDLYHEDLLKNAETRSREQFAAEKERKAKSGLLVTKQAPTLKPASKSKEYDKTEDILAELGIS